MTIGSMGGAYVVSQNFPDLPFLRKLSGGATLFTGVVYINNQIEKQFPHLSENVRMAEAGVIATSLFCLGVDLYQGNVPVDKILITAIKTVTLGQALPAAVGCAELTFQKFKEYLAGK